MEQSGGAAEAAADGEGARLKVTLRAPPHWVLVRMEPPRAQGCVSRQMEPSGMPYSHSTSTSCEEAIWICLTEKPVSA